MNSLKHKQTALVVDDAPENVAIMTEILGDHYQVKVALNGKKALSIAQSEKPPDIILLDVMMPEMDGYEVCRILKEDESTRQIPVIFVTAMTDIDNEAQGLSLGAVDYITKPVSPPLVLGRVGTQLRLYNQNRHLDELVQQRSRELMKAQAQLIQAEKMESVGRLAASIAHEVKNPLAIIQMGFYYLSDEIPENETVTEVLNDIDDAIQRADTVITGLLDFSHDRELELKAGHLNEVVKHSLHLVAHEMSQRNINIVVDLVDDLPAIMLDDNKLQQVLINLFMNSAQAMKQDGSLYVSSRLSTLDTSEALDLDCENNFVMGEQVLWLEVSDTGPGIREKDRNKIFEPFYTTKPVGEGTGLGLSVSRNIMNLHHGSIDIRNQKGGGASVVMMFKLITGENE